MVHIAIIDDNAVDRLLLSEQLQQDMKRRGIPYEVSEFTGGSEFLEQLAPGRFQIAFLDIYMGEPDGFAVAKVLYKKDPLCKIIFLTSSDEYVLDSFSVNATYYLLKNSKQSKFRQALDFCFPKKKDDTITVRTRNGIASVSKSAILYVLHTGRFVYIHLTSQVLESYASFKELTDPLLKDERFLLCSRGVLINMQFVSKQQDNDFIMQDGSIQPISRRSRANVLKAYQQFSIDETI